MEQTKDKLRLIESRRGAVVAVCLTGIMAALSFRDLAFHPRHQSYWLLDLRWILPGSAAAAVNIGFYAYLLWSGVVFYRYAQGRERVLVAGWFGSLFLGWIRNLVSTSVAAAMNWARAACMLVVFLAAVDIFLKTFASGDPRFDDQVSRNT
jgi:hypothetical protein